MTLCVAILDASEVPALIAWGITLGRALEEPVDLWLAPGTPEEELEQDLQARAERGEIVRISPEPVEGESAPAPDPLVPLVTVTRAEGDEGSLRETAEAVLSHVNREGVTHLLVGKHAETRRKALVSSLYERAACRVILMRFKPTPEVHCRNVLVPTAGGRHAAAALRIGSRLAIVGEGELTPLYVEPPFGRDVNEVGALVLKRILQEAELADADYIKPRVEISRDPTAAIARAAESDPDLVLLGASEAGSVRRSLFGTVPDRYLAGSTNAVAVVRERRRWATRIRARLEGWLDLTIPQLSRDERVSLFENIRRGSTWNFDFMALIGLSTAIATLGLLQNSAAVVIGAMLVAPLMTPIIGAGLSVVQGNLPLFRSATQAIVMGFLVAVSIGAAIGWLVPNADLTPELAARAGPTVLDLAVALFSGFAAAYCLGRPTLSAALPGVAIAAALVPPIATVGTSLAMGAWATARGASLLFATNVVAIVLGAALSLYGGGIRPGPTAEGQRPWARYVVVTLLVLMIPLAWSLTARLAPRNDPWVDVASAVIHEWPGVDLVRTLRAPGEPPVVEVWIDAAARPTDVRMAELRRAIEAEEGGAVRLRVHTQLVHESVAEQPSPADETPSSEDN